MSIQLTSVRHSLQPEKSPAIDKFRIVLIKPSKYDDDGYVIRFWRGVLPSNTLNVLHGLTEDVKQRRALGDIEIEVVTFDETAEKLPVKKIIGWSRRAGTKLLVCLVGVQTNQFPRAFDLAKQFRSQGIDVLMGGPLTGAAMNPARAFGPELLSRDWTDAWIWYVGPVAGATLAALAYATEERFVHLNFARERLALVV